MARRSRISTGLAAMLVLGALVFPEGAPAAREVRSVTNHLVSASAQRCVTVPDASPGDVAVINITNTQAAGTGWGALRASDAAPVYDRPVAEQYASVNFAADNPPNPNLSLGKVGPDRRVCYDAAVHPHHVILDLAAVIPAANVAAIAPVRILDSRRPGGNTTVSGKVGPSASVCVEVGSGAVPGDVAVINITNTQAEGAGWGALRASDAAPVYGRVSTEQYASVNFAASTAPNPNLALAKVGSDGEFCYDGAVAAHHVILDLIAFVPASKIDAIDPVRVLDTRGTANVAPSTSRCVEVAGSRPGDVAVVNITNTAASGPGWGALRSSDAEPVFGRLPANQYASVNFAGGTPPNPNLAFTKIGLDGEFCYDGAVGDHHVILDLIAVIPGANIDAIDPVRVLDTRSVGVPTAWTTILDDTDVADLTVNDDEVIIPVGHLIDDVAVGDVLTAGLTGNTPDGLFRLVTEVERTGGTVIATTEQADFTDALQDARLDASRRLAFDQIVPTPAFTSLTGRIPDAIDVDLERSGNGFVLSVDEVLNDQDGDESTTGDQITLAGTLAVEMDFDLDVNLGSRVLDSAKMSLAGSLSSNLNLNAAYAAEFGGSPKELFALEFAPITFSIGPVPVVIRMRVPLSVDFDGKVSAALDTSATASVFGEVGFEYDRGSWDAIKTFDANFDASPPQLDSSSEASASVGTELLFEFRVNEKLAVGSVGIGAKARVEMNAENPLVCVYGELTLPLRFSILGRKLIDRKLAEVDELLYPSSCDPDDLSGLDDVVPVPAYSRSLGACTSDGFPIEETGWHVVATGDGGVIIAANTGTTSQSDDAAALGETWVIRLDAAGEVVWEHRYDTWEPVGLVDTPNGPIVGTEYEVLFLRPDGRVRDVWDLRDADSPLRGIEAAPDGDGVVAFGGISIPWIARVGSDRILDWAREYVVDESVWGTRVYGMSPAPGGGWTVGLRDGYVMAIDGDGTPISARQIDVDDRDLYGFSIDTAAGPDGMLGYGVRHPAGQGRSIVLRIDESLAVTSDIVYEEARLASLTWRPDGHLVVAGSTREDFGDPVGLGLQRITPAGNLSWAVEYIADDRADARGRYGLGVTTTKDGGIVTVGATRSLAAETCGRTFDIEEPTEVLAWDLWVVKVPSTGLMTPPAGSGLERRGAALDVLDHAVTTNPVAVTSTEVVYEIDDIGFVDRDSSSATVAIQAP